MADIDVNTLGALIASSLPSASVPVNAVQRRPPLVVPYAATITLDLSVPRDFEIADLTGTVNILFSGLVHGRTGVITLRQDGVGNRIVNWAYSGSYKLVKPVAAVDLLPLVTAGATTQYAYECRQIGVGTPTVIISPAKLSGTRTWSGVASSSDGVKLAACVSNGYIYTSADSGLSWVQQTASGLRTWSCIASSADGTRLIAATRPTGSLYISTDSGLTWAFQAAGSTALWRAVASSADGQKLIACPSGRPWYSANGGAFVQLATAPNIAWTLLAMSADGVKLVGGGAGYYIYTSVDSGVTWTQRVVGAWYCCASSSDGVKLIAGHYPGFLYTSIDSGVTWTSRAVSRNWCSVASSSDGVRLVAADYTGYLYTSADSGVTWIAQTAISGRTWANGFNGGLALSADGTKAIAAATSLFASADSGATWLEV